MCGDFGNRVPVLTAFLYCLFHVYLYLFVTSARTTATEWKIISVNNNNNNNNIIIIIIVDLTTYCINSDRNVIIRNDLCLYVQLHYSNFSLKALGSGTAQLMDDFLC